MHDYDIRLVLDAKLRWRHGGEPATLIRHEVGICAGDRRIDVVLINDELAGYEIKSDEDTLSRLAGQAEAYGRVLDRAILVTTPRHLDDALAMLPNWWGVVVARTEQGVIRLEDVRGPALNEQYDMFSLAQFLWRKEAYEELRALGKSRGFSKAPRHYIWNALADAVSLDDLRSIVRARLRSRQGWSGGGFDSHHVYQP